MCNIKERYKSFSSKPLSHVIRFVLYIYLYFRFNVESEPKQYFCCHFRVHCVEFATVFFSHFLDAWHSQEYKRQQRCNRSGVKKKEWMESNNNNANGMNECLCVCVL